MKYNWQQNDWPNFTYDLGGIEDVLFRIAERMGRVDGLIEGLPNNMQTEALIDIMVSEAIKTSEIEGEYLSRKDVMSSIRNNLGFNSIPEQIKSKKAAGAAELMLAVRNSYLSTLNEDTLFSWHKVLMQGSFRVKLGAWRDHEEPMQVVSGLIGKEVIHYEAPPSNIVPDEMRRFIKWFNESAPGERNEIKQPAVRSAIAHFYFETIHPFEDGNGRIGRAISEKALAQGIGRPVLLSLSRTIEANKNAYYDALKVAQRSNEITDWIKYFTQVVLDAQIDAEMLIEFTLQKVRFFDRYREQLNGRQIKVLTRMLDSGPEGFEGGMSAKKYMTITKASKATATRDLQDLAQKGALSLIGGGRSTRYSVNL